MEEKVSAKGASKWSQIIMALWIAGWTAFTFLTGGAIAMGDIIASGVAIAASFSPIYLSIFLDKIKEIKVGGK